MIALSTYPSNGLHCEGGDARILTDLDDPQKMNLVFDTPIPRLIKMPYAFEPQDSNN